MNFIMVPFLLAIYVLPDEDKWINGPLYTFNVRVNTTSLLHKRAEVLRASKLLCKLVCRAKEPDRLICSIRQPRMAKLAPIILNTDDTRAQENTKFLPFEYGTLLFEIRFTSDGIESYTFANNNGWAMPFLYDMYRLIASQLSVGVDLRCRAQKKGGSFRAMENYTVGRCPTDYEIQREKIQKIAPTFKGETFVLLSLLDSKIGSEISDEEMLSINRWRRIEDCSSRSSYIFGAGHTYGLVPRDAIQRIETSFSRMMISRYNFVSETMNTFYLYDQSNEITGHVLEQIYLSLESVQPAEGKLERIYAMLENNAKIKNVIINAK